MVVAVLFYLMDEKMTATCVDVVGETEFEERPGEDTHNPLLPPAGFKIPKVYGQK